MFPPEIFDLNCQACPRLSDFLSQVKTEHPGYHCMPVAPYGTAQPKLLVVGLAPGKHGANATGRPFTGDYAGVLLYETLFKFGFSNQATVTDLDDGLELFNCRITNAVKCLPPENKPTGAEIKQCNHFLKEEINSLDQDSVILALGSIAHQAVLRAYGLKLNSAKFAHLAEFELPGGRTLIDSYHCSRYNVQTRRLSSEMFEQVFIKVVAMIDQKTERSPSRDEKY